MLSRRGIPSHSHRGNHGGWKRATDRYPPAALGIRQSGGADKKSRSSQLCCVCTYARGGNERGHEVFS
jgi:hypothetical protein